MKSTTNSQLAEQSYQDYIKETVPTDNKLYISYMFNEYSNHFGIPLRLAPNSPLGIAKLCRNTINLYSKWLGVQIQEAWKLGVS